jgi:glucan 1,3-beta-glucosidase
MVSCFTKHSTPDQLTSQAFSSTSSSCPKRSQNAYGTTGQPAIIYIPQGTYLMAKSLQMRLGTVLMGDPTNPPTLLATSTFANDHIIYGKDPVQPGTNNFYIAIKNLVIDSTNIDKDKVSLSCTNCM